jgi:hypothetical protein
VTGGLCRFARLSITFIFARVRKARKRALIRPLPSAPLWSLGLCGFRCFMFCVWLSCFLPAPPPPPPPRPPLLAKSRLNRGAKTQNILFCQNSPQSQNSRASQGGWPAGFTVHTLNCGERCRWCATQHDVPGIKATFSCGSLSRVLAYSSSRGIGSRMCHFVHWPKWHAPLY